MLLQQTIYLNDTLSIDKLQYGYELLLNIKADERRKRQLKKVESLAEKELRIVNYAC